MRSIALILGMSVCASALSLVYVRHQNRLQFVELQSLQVQRDLLNENWRQLLLEQGAWAEHAMVEKKARQKLDMQRPTIEETVVLTLRQRGTQ